MALDPRVPATDRQIGIAIAISSNENERAYVAQRDSLVSRTSDPRGVGPASQKLLKFGLFFFDYDLDGRLDVLTANGHLEPKSIASRPTRQYRQPAQLFWNRGQCSGVASRPCRRKNARRFTQTHRGRGSAFADIDGDGDLDVVLTQIGGPRCCCATTRICAIIGFA